MLRSGRQRGLQRWDGLAGEEVGKRALRAYETDANFQYRINLETREQIVLGAHGAPVKSVVYSKEHCKSGFSINKHKANHSHSPANLRIMGLYAPLPRPQEPR